MKLFWSGACDHGGVDDPNHASWKTDVHSQQEEEEEVRNIEDDAESDKMTIRAEYEEMRDDLLGDSEQLEEEVGFGEIMINQVRMVMLMVMVGVVFIVVIMTFEENGEQMKTLGLISSLGQ